MKNLLSCFMMVCAFTGTSYSQFEWNNTGGPFGSGSSFLFSNDTYAFIPENDFLFRSADGIYWEKLEHEVSNFLGVYHDTLVNSLQDKSSGLFHLQISFDNGNSWEVKSLPVEIKEYGDLEMCSHGIYLAQGFEGKIYKSTDLGDTWTSISAPDTFNTMKVFEDRLYVSGDSLLWRTDQNGGNWTDITPPLPHQYPVDKYVVDFVARDSHIVVTADQSMFLSSDNGKSWNKTYASSNNAPDKMTLAREYIYLNILGALIRTNDFGIHWDTLVTDFYPRPISFVGLGDVLLLTTYDRGVLRWDESAGKVVESNGGLSKGVVYDLSYGKDKIWAACGNGVFAYDIPTTKWSDKMNLPLPRIETSFVSTNDEGWVIYGEYYAEQFYLSLDQGVSWDTIKPGFEINDMQLLGENIFMFAGRFLRSIDKGMHWDTLSFGILSNEIIPFLGKNYIAGAGFLYVTNDNGLSWDAIKCPIKIFKLSSSCDKMYAIETDDISITNLYVSQDAIHWKYADTGLPDIDFYTLWYHYHPLFFKDGDFQYAFLGSVGHYISTDEGLSWSSIETSQTGNDYLIHDNNVYLGGEGMYSAQLVNPCTTVTESIANISNRLFSITPNPANGFVQIRFESELILKGSLQIFSSNGVMIKSINLNGTSESFTIPVQDLPHGLYYVLLRGDRGESIKSFVKS